MSTAVAKRESTAVKLLPLHEVGAKIRSHIDSASRKEAGATEEWIKAGRLLIQARERIDSGEEGDIDWGGWCERYAQYSRKHCERLIRWAKHPDPWQAIQDHRDRTRLAVAKHRENKAAELTVSSKPEPDDDDRQIVTVHGDFDDLDDDEPKAKPVFTALDDARRYYARELANNFGNDEMALIQESVKLDKARKAAIRKNRASMLPQDGRSEVDRGDPTPAASSELFAKLEAELKAKKK
jgi:hypothetical protein